ncbi:TIGR02099 family protein [Rhodoferax sp. U2-2l]|uniref:YhdP family protein n=1 Tax=Rhodoferax sp. U2-2l TaxID=2884000 RepID=UPI001D0A705E|nr:YhdP family protein [Rhodoferax sp. U2-2l]MCB8746047.1 TIGR02099 family protein [Rhodoferax sp. U2-2l]
MSPPSVTLLKAWSALTRGLLVAAVVVWLLLGATWGVLHGWIVPRIGDFRPQLEARASQALGVPVRLARVTAHSVGLMPSFELTGVEMLDDQGRVALQLPRVLVTLSPRSVMRLGFEQLYIDQPQLDIRRDRNGRILVAGLAVTGSGETDQDTLDWVFSQTELVIQGGTVRWTDELRQTEPLLLQHVDAVARNRGRHHDLRLDATPPAAWGDRFSLQGQFTQPLLTRQPGDWQRWQGQLFAEFTRVDLSELRRYASLGFDLRQGRGALRAWADVSQGQLTGVTADLALVEMAVTLGQDLQPLALQSVHGRLAGRRLANGFEVTTDALVFDTAEGLRWPGGKLRVMSLGAQGQTAARGELQADRLDLAALAQLADRLPLEPQLREKLLRLAPQGRVEALNASWQGPVSAPAQYQVTGRLRQLALAAVGEVPGFNGLDTDFQMNQDAGQAKVLMAQGSVEVPGMFQEPVIAVDQLSAEVSWKLAGDQISVDLANVRFSNADAEGQARIHWQTSDTTGAAPRSRFPGVLDLQASLSRADGRRVHRYLPLVIDAQARDYVRDAVLAGSASNVQFVVRGEIDQMPATRPEQGEFKVTADVSNARLAYVPRRLQEAQELPWPTLVDLKGQLVITGQSLQVKGAQARLGEGSALQIVRADVDIPDLMQTTVLVNAEMTGPLKDGLRFVATSPVAALTEHALSDAVAAGNADFKLKLALPIANLSTATVQGSVTLAGNELQVTPDTPKLSRARGVIHYTDTGFSLTGVQARVLGGDAQLDGGWVLADGAGTASTAPRVIRVSGTATAEGLRQARELGFVARLAAFASGSAAYNATLGWQRGQPEVLVTSSLQGLASQLPAPLQKDAASRLALRYQTALVGPGAPAGSAPKAPLVDRLSLSLDGLARVVYERDLAGAEPRVLRGLVAVGSASAQAAALPAQGVSAQLSLPQFNLDAWREVLPQITGKSQVMSALADAKGAELAYLPTTLVLRTDSLTLGERVFSAMVMGVRREGAVWRGEVDAKELNGTIEYRQPSDTTVAGSGGRVYARLSRLALAPTVAKDMEALLDAQPASIPALDIVVDDFELRGKRLGRLEVDAVNRAATVGGAGAAHEWRLNKLNLITPEATLTTQGNWTRLNAQAPGAAAGGAERRRTVLNFKLSMSDGGKLLSRFGMNDVIRRASGKMEGQVAWMGSPFKPDYPSLGGAFTVDVASGQFLKADPGLAKLLGVLSLQALPRRLVLDFRDVFSEGFAFDFVRGDVTLDKGIARTNNLQMKGVNAAVLMEGSADVARETQDLKVVVIPEINAGTASLIATVINPAVGLGTFLAQMFLRRPLAESATQQFHVDGSWADPQVTRIARKPAASVPATTDPATPSTPETPP